MNCHVQKHNKVYYQIVPVTLVNGDNKFETYAFFDSGSSVSLVKKEVVDRLQIKGTYKPMLLAWTNGNTQEDSESMTVEFKMISPNGKTFNLNNMRTVKDLSLPTQSINVTTLKKKFDYLKNIEFDSYEKAVPTILLGLQHAHLFRGIEERYRAYNEPVARLTKMGWLLYGSDHSYSKEKNHLFVIEEINKEERSMREIMSNFFSIESFGVKVPQNELISKIDERALKIMNDTIKLTKSGYEIGLLWKSEVVELPNSYKTALSRFLMLEKKLYKDTVVKDWYHDKIDEYLQKDYMRKLSPEEALIETPKTFYLPHFITVNKNKQPPKPRMVFDAAAKIDGVSLNSKLLSGPDMTESSLGVKMRFREGPITAITGDIEEMFHRVAIRKEDRESQRIISRKNPENALEIYEMNVMTFGATCSPACAQFIKNENARKFEDKYPEAVEAIIKNHYVDDYLDSFSDLTKATQIVLDVIKIHDRANFRMRNFISNSKALLKLLPGDRVSPLKEVKLDNEENTYEKVLGMYWDIQNDKYKFKIKTNTESMIQPTKRQLLSSIMSVYDPLGLISHITIEAKIIMQNLWRVGIDWDDKIPENINKEWQCWLKRLSSLDTLKISRCYSYKRNET